MLHDQDEKTICEKIEGLMGNYDEINKALGYNHDTWTSQNYKPIDHITGIESTLEISMMYHCSRFDIAVIDADDHPGKVVYAREKYPTIT